MKTIDSSNYLQALDGTRRPWQKAYYALYSSVLGGTVLDPALMQVPIDDHLVHRGDGVFDTFKCVGRGAYNLEAHLRRLMRSASAIGLSWPGGIEEIRALTLETLALAGRDACSGRVMLARGPGSFGVSPYESPVPALYIIVYAAGEPFMKRHADGATVRRSQVPVKPARFATVKNCNYLPNVMMKREAVDWGVDFVVGFDSDGYMAEGATENFGIVTRAGELLFPRVGAVLDGTTMLRVMQLADTLVVSGQLKAVAFRDVSEADVRSAAEMLVVGTTVNVASVRSFEGLPIGTGKPGPVGLALDALLFNDIAFNDTMRTLY
jgi:branched-chain amino acid aminotransferase